MFFFPFRDDNPTRATPWLTWALIAVCCGVFAQQKADLVLMSNSDGTISTNP